MSWRVEEIAQTSRVVEIRLLYNWLHQESTCVINKISNNFFDHIADNGIIVAPIVSSSKQILKKFTKKNDAILTEVLAEVLFVPNLKGVIN